MKRIINKTMMAIILALSMVLALLGGLLFANNGTVADAATGTTVTFKADKAAFFPGDTIHLDIEVTSTNPGEFYATTLDIGIMSSKTALDATYGSKFTYANFTTNVVTSKNSAQHPGEKLQYNENNRTITNGFRISLSRASGATGLSTSETLKFSIDVSVADDNDLMGHEFTLSVVAIKGCYVTTINGTTQKKDLMNDAANSTINSLVFGVRQASDNNKLDSLLVGQGTLSDPDDKVDFSDPDNLTVTVKDPSAPLDFELTTEDAGATVVLKPGDIPIVDGKGQIAIPANKTVTIVVTAENGTPKTYTLNVKVVGAMLTALTAETDTQTTGLMKDGLKETFASSTVEYTVYVPSDATKVTFNAKVSTGNSASDTLSLIAGGSSMSITNASGSAISSQKSGVDFIAKNITDGDTLSITCTATDGTTNSSKKYEVTFAVVDVDTSLDSIEVEGATSKKQFTNSTLKATEAGVEYYYMIVGETNGACKVTATTTSANATINLDGGSDTQTITKNLNSGSANATKNYTITVTAEAGNTESYVITIKDQQVLQLTSTAVSGLIFKNTTEEDGYEYDYIKSYETAGWEHGIDDVNLERLVIGKIATKTSINDFLANFEPSQLSKIRLCVDEDDVIYEFGNAGEDYDADEFDDGNLFAVATGMYVELVINGVVEDRIYLSVLGDVDGDGRIAAFDITYVGLCIEGVMDFDELEYYLAAMITNEGNVSSNDNANLGAAFSNEIDITDSFATY